MRPVPVAAAGAGRTGGPAAGPAGVGPSGPAGTRPANRADSARPSPSERLATMAKGFTALFLEVEAGRRPRAHLAPLMTPMLYARLSDVWIRGGAPGTVVSVRVVATSPTRCDVIALVRRGQRCGAVSLALTRTPRGWLVDDVALPEVGPLPAPPYPVATDDGPQADDLALVPLPIRRAEGPKTDWFGPTTPG